MSKNSINCDNCGKELFLDDKVYYERGYSYNACSPGCLANLRLVEIFATTVEKRLKQQ
jgi:hypothetical protein